MVKISHHTDKTLFFNAILLKSLECFENIRGRVDMVINPSFRLIKNNNKNLLFNQTTNQYFEIDTDMYSYIQDIIDGEEISEGDARTLFLKEKNIIVSVPNAELQRNKIVAELADIKVVGFHTDKLLSRFSAVISVIYNSKLFVLYKILLILSIICSIVAFAIINPVVGQDVTSASPSSISVFDIVIIYFAIIIIAFIHEMGHAISCKNYCGYVGESGIRLFFLLPALYTDITVSYSLPHKERYRIVLSGIINQLFISGLLSLILLFQYFLTKTTNSTILSINAINFLMIFVNLNPLFKFDGYWLLQTRWGTKNLYNDSIKFVLDKIRGTRISERKSSKKIFCYGVSAIIAYFGFWILTLTIIWSSGYPYIGNFTYIIIFTILGLIIREIVKKVKELF